MDLSVYSVDALPSVPPLPSAEQADRLAQELLAGYRSGAEAARRRYSRLHPRFERVDRSGVGATLGDARFVVAREGFDNWPRLRVAVQAAAVPPDRRVDAFLECSLGVGPLASRAGPAGAAARLGAGRPVRGLESVAQLAAVMPDAVVVRVAAGGDGDARRLADRRHGVHAGEPQPLGRDCVDGRGPDHRMAGAAERVRPQLVEHHDQHVREAAGRRPRAGPTRAGVSERPHEAAHHREPRGTVTRRRHGYRVRPRPRPDRALLSPVDNAGKARS